MDATARTAISRRAPSAPMRWLADKGLLKGKKLDYGCGLGFDAETFEMDGYDPHHFCRYEIGGRLPWRYYKAGTYPDETYDTATCVYVLNVLPPRDRKAVVDKVRKLLKPGGKAYFVVRRDKFNTKGQYLVTMKLPLIYERKGAFAVYCLEAD